MANSLSYIYIYIYEYKNSLQVFISAVIEQNAVKVKAMYTVANALKTKQYRGLIIYTDNINDCAISN